MVVSRADRLAEIGHEDVERAVGSPVRHSFPSDYRRALQALNKGRPVTLENHNELSGSFVKFAESLAGVEKARVERSAGTLRPVRQPARRPPGVQVHDDVFIRDATVRTRPISGTRSIRS